MPIKKKVIKAGGAPPAIPPPPAYEPPRNPNPFAFAKIPAISTRDLNYFFNLAASLYEATPPSEPVVDDVNDPPPAFSDSPIPSHSGPGPASASASAISTSRPDQVDLSAVLVLRLFRQTLSHVRPVAERFHLGPADRQPLYALTAQPSPRSAAEFNELSIKRRDPVSGFWNSVCTSDVEPCLDLGRPGHYKVASLMMHAVPVWRRVAAGQVTFETLEGGQGNKLCLWWGDRSSLGPIGDAYGLWWESGGEAGTSEAFYVVQTWGGFDRSDPGVVSVKPALKDARGQFVDPHSIPEDLATLYFYGDGLKPAEFVCKDVNTQIRLDLIIAGLMSVLTLETRRAAGNGSIGAEVAQRMGLKLAYY
ncbi:hypothetical protein N658DRAFT_65483 [Parathielavia hyrcaniae]|uniref:Uncharacterized protein n=1 Tax=Parathielavia hyrcaniae TaxID=113614 RepID=A0AAN6PVB5_9PEZI|nr:hypothetical protein N658DRAFT_65483 [Parathielavia hyrcaniae]